MAKLTAHVQINEDAMARVRRRLAGAVKTVHQHRLSVGMHEAEAHEAKYNYDGKPTHAQVIDAAYFAEFGVGQPQRSWLRAWYDQNVDRLKKESTEAMRAEYQGDANAVPLLARKWTEEIKAGLIGGTFNLADLSPVTKAARAKAGLAEGPPLVATHQLVDAIHGLADAEYVG